MGAMSGRSLLPHRRDLPPPPGLTLSDDGVDASVYAGHADAVELCLFEPGDHTGRTERRVALDHHAHGWWWTHVPGVQVGQRYGFRVHGPWSPEHALRHNPHKLLLDPYARALEGEVTWGPEVYAHVTTPDNQVDGVEMSLLDSAGAMPRCVLVDDTFDWEGDQLLARSRAESVIYETHVRNLTMRLPGVPEHLRGTYAGLAHSATIAHLTDLGVTAVELLPVHAFTTEPALVRRGLRNHWGYNTLGFFAPHPAYAAAGDPQGVLDEFKGMVKLLHRAGIEVLLDVVYNHSAEQSVLGPTFGFRGLDARAYYKLDERGRDIDVTGCGNTMDLTHPTVCRMALDSLRYWVSECHVDGFRFDLAVALGRGRGEDYDPDHPFLVALRTDPLLSRVKLIAEPWDIGVHGWRTGQFPPPFSEWNDRFRDATRTFWLRDRAHLARGQSTHGVQDLATRLAGSRDLFGERGRGPVASVNFVTAHDGFTLHDLTAYDRKRNEANGEDNRDGTDNNASWNHGHEGPTSDPGILLARRRTMRTMLGTLLVAHGVPMLTAGDEIGRTQLGNNNPYNQDNEISWLDWELQPWQRDLLETTRYLIALRREHPVLHQREWTRGVPCDDGRSPEITCFDAQGHPMGDTWGDVHVQTLQMHLGACSQHRSIHVVLHNGLHETEVRLPAVAGTAAYELLWDSAWERPREAGPSIPARVVPVAAGSMQIYADVPEGRDG